MPEMNFIEIAVYSIMLLTSCVIAWQIAKFGIFEIGIQIPPNKTALIATTVGVLLVVVVGFLDKNGYVNFALAKKEEIFKAALLFNGIPLIFYFIARYLFLPKGLPEYNRAKTRTVYWTIKNYRPGVKLKEEGKILADFPRAQHALRLFEKSIEKQSHGVKPSMKTKTLEIDQEQFQWDGKMNVSCPNCGFHSKAPIYYGQGEGMCIMCNCSLVFKVMGNFVHVTAYGPKLARTVTSACLCNMAVAYEEMALLLRMMNKFVEAKESLSKAEKIINDLLEDEPDKKEYLGTKSLIIFRKGELAHTLGNRAEASNFYRESLAIDRSEHELVDSLIKEVS